MRIELKDENQEEPQKIDENDIRYKHETDLTKKEKRELEKMKLASMGWKGKLQYIWAYYKPQMAAIVAVIAIAFFVKDLYENSRIHTALTVMVIDSYGTKQEEAEEKVEKALGIQDDPYEIVTVDESLRTGEDGVALESYSQMAFTTKVSARAVDVLIGSENYMDGFEFKDEYFMDLTELLPEEVYQAFGEQNDKYSITIDSDIAVGDSGGSVTATANGSNYDVTDVDIVNDDGEWVDGDVPRVEITLEADSDYYFASMAKSKVSLKGDKATYVSSRREDSSSTLIITVKLDDLEGTMEIDNVSWENDNSPVATWETTSGAVSYQVRLYRGSSSVGSAVTTSSEYYNFASSITREGEYYFNFFF